MQTRDVFRRVFVVGLASLTLAGAAGCLGDSLEAPLETETPKAGVLRGELVVHVLDFADHAERLYTLRLEGGGSRKLELAEAPQVPPGSWIEVSGHDDGRTVLVSDLRLSENPQAPSAVAQALIEGKKKPVRNWAFILVDTGGGLNITKAEAQETLFGAGKNSIRGYYEEVSYGLQAITGDVLGPFEVDVDGSICSLGTAAEQMVEQIAGNIEKDYDQYLWYVSRMGGCPWAGAAQQGRAARPTQHSFYNASKQCTTLAQEPGHNFGMVHSSAMLCREGNQGAILPGEGIRCAHVEYGSPFDPMGRGCGHMNGVQKAYQGWLEGCNVVKANKSGTFTIFPLESPCNGVQLLQVPTAPFRFSGGGQNGTISSYFLELRTPVGFDATAVGRGDIGSGSPVPLGVYVTAGADIRGATGTGNPNWLLDMTPGSRGGNTTADLTDAAMRVGQTFTDPNPGGPKITVVSATMEKAVIRVELAEGGGSAMDNGEGTCLDGASFTAPGPATCQAAPVSSPGMGSTPPDAGRPPLTFPDAGPVDNPDPQPAPSAGSGGNSGGGEGGSAGSDGAGGSAGSGENGNRGSNNGGSDGKGGSGPAGSSGQAPGVAGASSGGCSLAGGPSGAPDGVWLLLGLGFALFARRRRPASGQWISNQ